MAWVKATSGEQYPVWDKEKDKEIEGVLVEKKEGIGQNESHMYVIETGNGKKQSVWGTSLLDNVFTNIQIGTMVKIVYKGKEKGKRGTSYHNFEVLYDDGNNQ